MERPAPRERRPRRTARGLAAVLAGTALALATAPTATAYPGLAPTADAEYPVVVEIDSVSPTVAAENGTLTVTGKVRNTGHAVLKSAQVGLRGPNRPVETRSGMATVMSRTTPTTSDGTDLASSRRDLGDLAAGQLRDFTFTVPVADLKLRSAGVYELAVDVRDTADSRPLGIARTFLPYNAGASGVRPTQLSVFWPLTHAPELVAQTMPDNDQLPVLRDDNLAAELAPGGRLYQLVDTGATLTNLTWAIDPDLLDTVYAMTKPYRVQKPGTAGESAKDDNTVAGTGRDAAVNWLKNLRTAVAKAGDEVVALPYADPDLASIAHNGVDQNGLDAVLRKAVTAGQVTAEGRLGVPVRSDVAWPYRDRLDQRVTALTRAIGSRLVVTDGDSLSDDLRYTANAARPIGEGQTALVADPTLSELFQGDLANPADSSAAVQRFAAETLMITNQQPGQPRSLLLTPSRTMTAATAGALASALKAAQDGGWLAPARLEAVAGAPADPSADTSVPADYPKALTAGELPGDLLGRALAVEGGLDQLIQILTQPQRVRGPFNAAMIRSMSTGWRGQPKAGEAYQKGVEDYLANLAAAVKVPNKTVITLPGDSATLLISVKNDLNQPVGNLQLRLTSGQLNRLRVLQAEPVTLDATTSRTFRFPAQAAAPGAVLMTAQLWTTGPNPQPYGEPVTFTVEVTSVASGVMYVIGGGVVLMVLAGLRFYRQRKKIAAADEPDSEGPDPAGPDSDGPEPDADESAPQPGTAEQPGGPEAEAAAETPAATPTETAPETAPNTAADAASSTVPDSLAQLPRDEKVGH